jgi:thiol-disulfide isomerase/thioredoxin
MPRGVLLAFAALALSPAGSSLAETHHPEAQAYDAAADAGAQLAAARDRSRLSGKPLLLVLGANWCHDSRALAGWLETPRLRDLVAANFELLFVDVGRPQTGEGRNLEIARRFGIANLSSTPALLVIMPDGTVLNRATATAWRNAAHRSGRAIYREIARFAADSRSG